MGTISNARASTGLQASGTPTGTNVTGAVNIGQPQITLPFDDADIAYAFSVEDGGGDFGVTLDLPTGAVTIDSGTPTLSDGDGNDFEGVTLPGMATFYGLYVSFDSVDAGGSFALSSTNAALPDIPTTSDGKTTNLQYLIKEGVGGTLGTITINGTAGLGSYGLTMTVIGKSS